MQINVGYVLVPDVAVGLPSSAPLRGILMFSYMLGLRDYRQIELLSMCL